MLIGVCSELELDSERDVSVGAELRLDSETNVSVRVELILDSEANISVVVVLSVDCTGEGLAGIAIEVEMMLLESSTEEQLDGCELSVVGTRNGLDIVGFRSS